MRHGKSTAAVVGTPVQVAEATQSQSRAEQVDCARHLFLLRRTRRSLFEKTGMNITPTQKTLNLIILELKRRAS